MAIPIQQLNIIGAIKSLNTCFKPQKKKNTKHEWKKMRKKKKKEKCLNIGLDANNAF
jgi:hypothetical protein